MSFRRDMDDRQPVSASRWSRIQELFRQALELTPDERARFVETACGDDTALRDELASLLRRGEERPAPRSPPGEPVGQLAAISDALADRYRVRGELGSGGMATVYLADDIRHDRPVAIKVLWPSVGALVAREHFLRGIGISAKLRHPHILPLYDSGGEDGLLYFVMPYVEGETLRERIDRDGRVPVHQALGIAREVAEALGHAHARGVVHRDIKPANLFLEAGHAVVADFGVGNAFEQGADPRTGLTMGTPLYMSPEQVSGEEAVDGRSDLYSLGCVLFEALTGFPPFRDDSVAGLIRQHLLLEPPSAASARPSLPSWIDGILAKALAKRPDDRFQTADEMAEALGEQRSWRTVSGGESAGNPRRPGQRP